MLKHLKEMADYHIGNILINKRDQKKKKFHMLKRIYMIQTMLLTFLMLAVPVYAADMEVDTSDLIGRLIGIILFLFFYVGLCVLIWGIISFFLAIKKQDGESKADAVQTMIAGIALMVLRPFVNALGLGVDIIMPENM